MRDGSAGGDRTPPPAPGRGRADPLRAAAHPVDQGGRIHVREKTLVADAVRDRSPGTNEILALNIEDLDVGDSAELW